MVSSVVLVGYRYPIGLTGRFGTEMDRLNLNMLDLRSITRVGRDDERGVLDLWYPRILVNTVALNLINGVDRFRQTIKADFRLIFSLV